MQELGKRYLEEIRVQNMHVTPQLREAMDKKRFERMNSVPKLAKSRKYLDQIARDFKESIDLVVQKDLTRNLNPTRNTDSHNAFIHNMKYFDNRLDYDETKLRYKAGGESIGLELGDKYISSIQTKLNVLQKEAKANKQQPNVEGEKKQLDKIEPKQDQKPMEDPNQNPRASPVKDDKSNPNTKPSVTKPDTKAVQKP
jgi:hypothetical protein